MSTIGVTLIWCVLQVTLLSVVGAMVYLLVRRFSVAAAALVAATTLVWVAALTFLAFMPSAQWTLIDLHSASPPAASSGEAAVTEPAPEPTSGADLGPTKVAAAVGSGPSFTELFWREFRRVAQDEPAPQQRTYLSAAAIVFLALALLGAARITVAFFSLSRLRARSVVIHDRRLKQMVSELSAALGGLPASLEVRESSEFSSAATLGWRRPLVLLPLEWREWSDDSLRAVLAHELAHIARRDYLVWLIAQVGVTLHAYHPLVWWLSGRLRQEQECAADAEACRLSGGPNRYLTVLATLALAEDDRRLAWSAHPFLPTRHTFLRRLHMLRKWKQAPGPLSRGAQLATVVVLTGLALLASGLRTPATSNAQATGGIGLAAANPSAPHALEFVPRDAVMIISVQVEQLVTNKMLAPFQKAITEDPKALQSVLGVNLDEIQQIQFVYLVSGERLGPGDPCIIVHTRLPIDENLVIERLDMRGDREAYVGFTIHRNRKIRCAMADPQTILISDDIGNLRRCLVAGKRSAEDAPWLPAFRSLSDGQVVLFSNTPLLRPQLDAEFAGRPRTPQAEMAAMFFPLYQNTQTVGGKIRLHDATIELSAEARCQSDDDAKAVEETVQAALVLAKNSLAIGRGQAARDPGESGVLMLRTLDQVEKVLDQREVARDGTTIRVSSKLDAKSTTELINMMLPAVVSARKAAARMQSMNNLKQITIAMHNYHDVYKHFPPPVLTARDGKTKYSWRVAILPFIEQSPLYDQYRFNEPWDSPNNQLVMQQMPDVFRSPDADANDLSSSYYALVGPGTAFGNPQGRKLSEILDGTSNTIMVVEAKRDIPWTQPMDIDYDPAKEIPQFGGFNKNGFLAALCDGSVHHFPLEMDARILHLMIQGTDGQPVDWQQFRE